MASLPGGRNLEQLVRLRGGAFRPSSNHPDGTFKLIGLGISLQFATSDSATTSVIGFYDAGWPASSQRHHNRRVVWGSRTASIAFQTAWGNNITEIADTVALGSPPLLFPNEAFDFRRRRQNDVYQDANSSAVLAG